MISAKTAIRGCATAAFYQNSALKKYNRKTAKVNSAVERATRADNLEWPIEGEKACAREEKAYCDSSGK